MYEKSGTMVDISNSPDVQEYVLNVCKNIPRPHPLHPKLIMMESWRPIFKSRQ